MSAATMPPAQPKVEEIERVLRFDPLAHAEDITGRHHSDDGTAMLGFGMAIAHNRRKQEVLEAAGDTHFSQTLGQWIAVVEGMGFALVFNEAIPETADRLRIWWRDGILLKADSYNGDAVVNSAEAYFNYAGPREAMYGGSSGFLEERGGVPVWDASLEAREGFKHNIQGIEALCSFPTPWGKKTFLWLLHYMDTKAPQWNCDAINAARIATFPAHVRQAITGVST
jgi:hypothetical protein